MSANGGRGLVVEHSGDRQLSDESGAGRAIVVCDQWLGSDGYAGLRALRRAGYNVLSAPEWEFVPVRWRSLPLKVLAKSMRGWAVAEFNRELLRMANRFQPDLMLVFKGTFVRGQTLRALRESGVRTYCVYTDVSFLAHGPYIPRALPEYDWVFTTKSFGISDMRSQLGVTNSSLILFAADLELHQPIPLTPQDISRFGCDVSYIGTWSPKKERLLSQLIQRRPNLHIRIWGEQWHKASTRVLDRAIEGGEVTSEDFVRAIRGSDINLSILSEQRRGASRGDQIANRTFSVPACNAFVLHERTDEVLALFKEGEQIECFADCDELIEKIDRYLPNPDRRRLIAENAYRYVAEHHTWDHRIATILHHHRGAMGISS